MNNNLKTGERMASKSTSLKSVSGNISTGYNWLFVHKDKDGNVKDQMVIENRIVDEGLDYALDSSLGGGTQIIEWYIGLTDANPNVAPEDTMSSHAGWSEVTQYEDTTRPVWNSNSVSNQSISNTVNPAVFVFDADGVTVGGAFLVSDNTKGGTTGTLYAAGAFEKGDKSFDIGDTIEVTAIFTNSYGE